MHQVSQTEESSARRVTPVQVSRDVRKSRLLGLVNRKERWGLSWIGWLMLLFMLVLAGSHRDFFDLSVPFHHGTRADGCAGSRRLDSLLRCPRGGSRVHFR